MTATYPHKWVSAVGDDSRSPAGRAWARSLAGLTRQHIDRGLDACRNSSDPWPPSLPEFKALCLGIPSFAAVKLDTERAEPFTRMVWLYLDGFRMRQVSAEQGERMMRDAYELAREHAMRGGELPEPVPAIKHEKDRPNVPADPAERQRRIEQARRDLGTPQP